MPGGSRNVGVRFGVGIIGHQLRQGSSIHISGGGGIGCGAFHCLPLGLRFLHSNLFATVSFRHWVGILSV